MPNWKCGFCMHMLVYVGAHADMCVCVCRGTCRSQMSMFSSPCFTLLFETWPFTWTWSSLILSNHLAIKLQGLTCSTSSQGWRCTALTSVLEVQTQISVLVWQVLYSQSPLPSPNAVGRFSLPLWYPMTIIKWNSGSFLTLDCKGIIQYDFRGGGTKEGSPIFVIL